ncbi:MAG: pyridoxamine 5'-phosphate oxidase [Gammaproteobacteria bacterium]|nr:pyridoxamine 5'-phosphate oxidase [Gammaproteobacteria bacterium]
MSHESDGDQRDVRRKYALNELRRTQLRSNPAMQFKLWMDESLATGQLDATAMSLATVNAMGAPSVRIVLLKHYKAHKFVWYTDYRSQKGNELAVNPQASVLFYWRELERQIRISGTVEKIAQHESAAYFGSRPRDSQLSAAASTQSHVIESRDILAERVLQLQFSDDVVKPEDWGGYQLNAHEYEFWQGRVSRLHDRFRYRLVEGVWLVERLQP